MELVSIIIPVYNVEDFIEQCIESVLSQDYKNLEIIVVDDGSTDKSVEIVKKFKDDRIIILHKNNGGLSSARNYGIKHCNGTYIFFLDSDDWIEHDAISNLIDNMSDGIDIVQGSIRRVERKKITNNLLKNEILNEDILLEYFKKEKLNTVVWNKLYRKEFIKDIPFYEGYVNEDVIFTFQIAKKLPHIKNISAIIYNYRIRSDSIMHQKKLSDRLKVLQSLDQVIYESKSLGGLYVNLAYYDKYITLLYLYAYVKNRQLVSDEESISLLLNETKDTKKEIKILKICKKVNRKQFFSVYLPSLISKDMVAFLFKIKG